MGFFDDQERLLRLQRQLTVVALVAFIGFVTLQISAFFADLLRILALSLLVSYAVISAVDFLDRFLRNRALAVALVYCALAGIVVVAGLFIIPMIVFQITSLASSTVNAAPELLHRANEALIPVQQKLNEKMIDIKVMDVLTQFAAQLPKPDPSALVGRLSDMAMGTMTWTIYWVSISVVTFYFLLDGHRIKDAIITLFPQKLRMELGTMATEMDRALQAFFKGQIVLGIGFGVLMLGVYAALHVQYALLLSAFLAICEILPVIGPPIGFLPAIISVAVHGSSIPGNAVVQIIILTAIFMLLQQVKDSVVGPKYMGNVIGMHPVMIFIAIMVGARLDGMLGIVISLPAAAVISVILAHLRVHDRDEHMEVTAPVTTTRENTAASSENPDI